MLVKILSDSFVRIMQMIPRIRLTSSWKEFPFPITRRQCPVGLCFAMTIHKSQGQSFEDVGVDMREPVSTHGQF